MSFGWGGGPLGQGRQGEGRRDPIGEAIVRADFLRRSPFPYSGVGGHKEWWHFCVHGPEVAALINFSLVDERRREGPAWVEVSRLTCLVHDGAWDGDVEVFGADEAEAPGGRVRARYGHNVMFFADGAYHIRVKLRERPVEMDLVLRPTCLPGRAPNLPLEGGSPIQWVVVPRLLATGTITVGGKVHHLRGAPAYHDHNWGHWSWGDDFAWEWGFGLSDRLESPWHMVFVRLTNRARTRILAQALSIWRDGRQRRTFREQDVVLRHEGLLRPSAVTKIPRVMGLVAPELPTDVPRRLHVSGRTSRDAVSCVFEGHDVGQVIIPNDHDFGVTIINEVSGYVSMEGQIGGEDVHMAGRAVFEFLGS